MSQVIEPGRAGCVAGAGRGGHIMSKGKGARIKKMQNLFLACSCFNLNIFVLLERPGHPGVCLPLNQPLFFADLQSVYRKRHLQRDGSC